MYSVKPKNANRFRRDFANLTQPEREKVRLVLEGLAVNPRPPGCICLEKNYYRVRAGNVRILYQIFDAERTILVGAVVRRDEKTYREWRKYFR